MRKMSGSQWDQRTLRSARASAHPSPLHGEPDPVTLGLETLIMADSQKSMVSIVAIIAIVILVGIVVWFMRQESNDGLQIEIGLDATQIVFPTLLSAFPL